MATSKALKTLSRAAVGAALMITGTLPARAAVMFYTNRAAFEADTTGLTAINFEGIADSGSFVYTPSPSGLSLSGINFADNTVDKQYVIDSGFPGYEFMGSDFLSSTSPGSTADITFSNPVTAVGTDISGIARYGIPFQFALSTGESFIYRPQEENIGFLGFTSTTPITSLTISPLDSLDNGPQLDNFTVGQAKPVAITAPDDAFQVFFGEDEGLGRDTRLASRPNADAARDSFLSNLGLGNVGTETFESFEPCVTPPLTLNFSGASTATLEGSGRVCNTPTGTSEGVYPISGNQYFTTLDIFSIDFSQEINAFGFYGIDVGNLNAQIVLQLENTLTGLSKLLTLDNTASFNQPGGSVLYYGVIAQDDFSFNKVTFANTAIGYDYFALDDLTIASIKSVEPQAVPESTSVWGWILGVVGAGLLLKHKQKLAG